jgi:hypothetical protein
MNEGRSSTLIDVNRPLSRSAASYLGVLDERGE